MQAKKCQRIQEFFEQQHRSRKVLFLIDESDLSNSLTIVESLSKNNIETEIYVKTDRQGGEILNNIEQLTGKKNHYVSDFENNQVETLLNEQLMGTKIFISGAWESFNRIQTIANRVGFSDDELYFNGVEESNNKVYCVKCYSYNINTQNSNEITCEHCGTNLDVSGHFSKRLDAYLGYIQD